MLPLVAESIALGRGSHRRGAPGGCRTRPRRRAHRMGCGRARAAPKSGTDSGASRSQGTLWRVVAPCSPEASSRSSSSTNQRCRGCSWRYWDESAASSLLAPAMRSPACERTVSFVAACFPSCVCVSATRFIPAATTHLPVQPVCQRPRESPRRRPAAVPEEVERWPKDSWIAAR